MKRSSAFSSRCMCLSATFAWGRRTFFFSSRRRHTRWTGDWSSDVCFPIFVAPRVRLAMWQLVVAFAVLVLWRARRLGRPVAEAQPVQIPGSELVVAVGNLLQRARGRGQAAGLLTDDLRRTLAER